VHVAAAGTVSGRLAGDPLSINPSVVGGGTVPRTNNPEGHACILFSPFPSSFIKIISLCIYFYYHSRSRGHSHHFNFHIRNTYTHAIHLYSFMDFFFQKFVISFFFFMYEREREREKNTPSDPKLLAYIYDENVSYVDCCFTLFLLININYIN